LKKIFLGALVCLAGWFVWEFFPGDKRLILRRLDSLAALASVREDSPPLSRFATTERLRDFFDPAVVLHLNLEPYGEHFFSGRDELMDVLRAARTHLREANFHLFDITVEIGADRKTATAMMSASSNLNGEANAISQQVEMILKKTDATWVIARVDTVHPTP